MTAAAWKYYVDTGLVTGGNYDSGQVLSFFTAGNNNNKTIYKVP